MTKTQKRLAAVAEIVAWVEPYLRYAVVGFVAALLGWTAREFRELPTPSAALHAPVYNEYEIPRHRSPHYLFDNPNFPELPDVPFDEPSERN